ncbi:hypothetical protein IHE61_05180 [Streptomyces sp. GKU 257-1]|nr:hypothetical protein [Streptomyces sp. GKU 257-1]
MTRSAGWRRRPGAREPRAARLRAVTAKDRGQYAVAAYWYRTAAERDGACAFGLAELLWERLDDQEGAAEWYARGARPSAVSSAAPTAPCSCSARAAARRRRWNWRRPPRTTTSPAGSSSGWPSWVSGSTCTVPGSWSSPRCTGCRPRSAPRTCPSGWRSSSTMPRSARPSANCTPNRSGSPPTRPSCPEAEKAYVEARARSATRAPINGTRSSTTTSTGTRTPAGC